MANEAMSADDTLPTFEELRESPWSAVVETTSERECYTYSTAFLREAELASSAGRTGDFRALRLLGHLTSMAFQLDRPSKPLVPRIQLAAARTAALEDFESPQLALLKDFAQYATDAELKARSCDVLWLVDRDHLAAASAIDAYLESAAILEDPERCAHTMERLERAAQIAAALRRHDLVDKVIREIDGFLHKYAGKDPRQFSARLMGLLLKYEKGDPSACVRFSETAAVAAEKAGDPDRATAYLELKAEWQRRGSDRVAAAETKKRIGEIWARRAAIEASTNPPAFTHAVMYAQRAIRALEGVPNTRERRREIHASLLRYQEGALADLKRFEVTRDVSELVQRAEALVSGKSPGDAIAALALAYQPLEVAALRTRVQALVREQPLRYLFSSIILTNRGRVAAQRGALNSGRPEESESAFRAEMCRELTLHHSLVAQSLIEPARRRISFEHRIREEEIGGLLRQSPFVPEGREALYAKGIWAGLHGDFTTSTHLLVPQVEHSVRVLLAERDGVLTSSLKPDGTQEELDLNSTLRMEEMNEVFGEDVAFDLRTLLVERFGSNLRNRVAHGLMHQHEFATYDGAYLWWVCLHFCIAPLVIPEPRLGEDTGTSP
jgi:hypothetical protein